VCRPGRRVPSCCRQISPTRRVVAFHHCGSGGGPQGAPFWRVGPRDGWNAGGFRVTGCVRSLNPTITRFSVGQRRTIKRHFGPKLKRLCVRRRHAIRAIVPNRPALRNPTASNRLAVDPGRRWDAAFFSPHPVAAERAITGLVGDRGPPHVERDALRRSHDGCLCDRARLEVSVRSAGSTSALSRFAGRFFATSSRRFRRIHRTSRSATPRTNPTIPPGP